MGAGWARVCVRAAAGVGLGAGGRGGSGLTPREQPLGPDWKQGATDSRTWLRALA